MAVPRYRFTASSIEYTAVLVWSFDKSEFYRGVMLAIKLSQGGTSVSLV